MSTTDVFHAAVAFGVGLIGGVINAVAAGGTLLTFPTLIWLGLNSVTANATSTVAVWPFVLGGVFGYRRELRTVERRLLYLVIPSLLGGLGGAILLRSTPSSDREIGASWYAMPAAATPSPDRPEPLTNRHLHQVVRFTRSHGCPTLAKRLYYVRSILVTQCLRREDEHSLTPHCAELVDVRLNI